ncbi:MAG: phage head morphogenesis protein, partial [Muribaculaceae bacterium]|nr:phage head morphogenesis protein [Muribaculaceae bacterium]
MMKAMYKTEGAQLSIDILSTPQVREFIDSHASVLDSSFEKVEMSDAMRRRLQRSNWIFSGMKTFHELNEAFPSLIDENGDRKSFERFLNDVRSIDQNYNSNYLRAEYNFVTASAEMAAKWEGFMQDGDRYNLQYRTQKDDKVRPEHAALDGVTLPASDPFWAEFYPPNGWNCRCTVVQVRKSKYPATPHDEAMHLGDEALKRDSKGIFRFNPGIEQSTVPAYNPYTIRRCRDCDIAKGKSKLARITPPDNQLCEACSFIRASVPSTDAGIRIKKYNPDNWEYSYISSDNTGFVVTSNDRIKEAQINKSELKKYQKELSMCKDIADNGHEVVYLSETNREPGKTYDVMVDGIPTDLKALDGYGNLVKRVNHALNEQGAELVVLRLPSHSK